MNSTRHRPRPFQGVANPSERDIVNGRKAGFDDGQAIVIYRSVGSCDVVLRPGIGKILAGAPALDLVLGQETVHERFRELVHLTSIADHGEVALSITEPSRLVGQSPPKPLSLRLVEIDALILQDSRTPVPDQFQIDAGRRLIPQE